MVAVVGEAGTIGAMAAEHIERPVIELDRVEWSMLVDFLECGQLYE